MTKQSCLAACEPGACDTFQFMAKTLKMKVLHPGGLKAAKLLAEKCGISTDMTILDNGCYSARYSLRHQ